MIEPIEDLTPFFQDPCWMFVHFARQANIGIILTRGPTEWWHVTLWNTRRDVFESGQSFRGSIYPAKCDVSPNGKLFIYFAGKFNRRQTTKSYRDTWTAVSRPPYLTALALWPMGGTWGGDGLFIDDQTVLLGHLSPQHHPDHPLGPLRLMDRHLLNEVNPSMIPSWNNGWRGVLEDWRSLRHFPRPISRLLRGSASTIAACSQ
jgi:hypothetical protein